MSKTDAGRRRNSRGWSPGGPNRRPPSRITRLPRLPRSKTRLRTRLLRRGLWPRRRRLRRRRRSGTCRCRCPLPGRPRRRASPSGLPHRRTGTTRSRKPPRTATLQRRKGTPRHRRGTLQRHRGSLLLPLLLRIIRSRRQESDLNTVATGDLSYINLSLITNEVLSLPNAARVVLASRDDVRAFVVERA